MTELPHVLAEIATVAGEDAAHTIAAARGGTTNYIPPVPDAEHWLSKLVGLHAARAIADHFTCGVGGLRLAIPYGPAGREARGQRQVDQMIIDGRASVRDIVEATGYCDRTVYRRRAKLLSEGKLVDDRQLDLF